MPPGWTKQKLTNVQSSATDIASHEIGVHALEIGGRKNAPGQDAVAEAGSEALDLIFQFLQHVDVGSIRYVTISPGNVFARWSARVVKEARLGQKYEGVIGVPTASDCFFRGSDLLEASTEMDGGRTQAIGGSPGNGAV